MYQFIETIKLEDGDLIGLDLHQERLDRTLLNFYPNRSIDLCRVLEKEVLPTDGLYRLTVTYSDRVEKIKWVPYRLRSIDHFVLVEAPDVAYRYKYSDREIFSKISEVVPSNCEAIITQKGLITDTTYTNLIFMKEGQWYTPSTALLKGTQRERLLRQGTIKELDIRIDNLHTFDSFRVINAMMDMSMGEIYDIKKNVKDFNPIQFL